MPSLFGRLATLFQPRTTPAPRAGTPGVRAPVPAPAPSPILDPGFADPVIAAVRSQLEAGNTSELESLLASVRHPDDRYFYVERLSDATQGAWLGDWIKREPKSPAANLVGGVYMIHAAWRIRGSGYASSVPPEAWDKFFERLRCAEDLLQLAAALDKADPTPWAFLLRTARGLQLENDEAHARFERVRQLAPYHRPAHSQYLQGLCEKWGGSHEKMFAFARETSQAAPPGVAVHALVAEAHVERWLAEESEGPSAAYFTDPQVREEIAGAAAACFTALPGCPQGIDSIRSRNYFAFCFHLAGDAIRANEHFHAAGNWVTDYPWCFLGKPLEAFARAQAQASPARAAA